MWMEKLTINISRGWEKNIRKERTKVYENKTKIEEHKENINNKGD